MTDWDAELKKIDKQLESMSDSALIPAPAKNAPPAAKAAVAVERSNTRTWPREASGRSCCPPWKRGPPIGAESRRLQPSRLTGRAWLIVRARPESSNAEFLPFRSPTKNRGSRGYLNRLLIGPHFRSAYRQVANTLDHADAFRHRNRAASVEQVEQV